MTSNELVKMTLIKLINGVSEFEQYNGSSKLSFVFEDLSKRIRNEKQLTDEDIHDIGEEIANIYFEDFVDKQ